MNKSGPIIIIEDDMDDQEVLVEIFERLKYTNKVFYFADGNEALEFINQSDVQPFLILSDINMPKIKGFDLRNKVFTNEKLHTKCIPYLFFHHQRHQEVSNGCICVIGTRVLYKGSIYARPGEYD